MSASPAVLSLAGAAVLPAVIGHRGAAARAPENTLASFEAAAAAGARWVEFDVRLSADGVPFVIHDETLDRTAGSPLRVEEARAADLRAAGAGGVLSDLDETLDRLAALGLGANVEIKPQRRRAAVAAATAVALARRPLSRGVIVSSFDAAIVAAFGRVAPDTPRGLLVRRPCAGAAARARALGCVSIHCGHGGLSEAVLGGWRNSGFATLAYTVNEPARARQLLSWGLDAVITDDPGRMLARLGRETGMARGAGRLSIR